MRDLETGLPKNVYFKQLFGATTASSDSSIYAATEKLFRDVGSTWPLAKSKVCRPLFTAIDLFPLEKPKTPKGDDWTKQNTDRTGVEKGFGPKFDRRETLCSFCHRRQDRSE